ncbi:protein PALE CRESS, chloroplastic [Salvia hispanica]|uniref:protein PALE CRESS, chloroplastic n=1 Tax=Salvia hispanica TaxID=49212 RepID=UPI0020098C01|nr:protein PALE CRESS, chloroplastic [Salvia hispanica]
MEAKFLQLLTSSSFNNSWPLSTFPTHSCFNRSFSPQLSVASSITQRCKKIEEQDYIPGLPKEYYDDEWQARQREKTKEFHKRRQEEDEEEERKVDEYRQIGLRLKNYRDEDLRKAKKLVSSFIRSAEEVEERIVEAAEKGELTELVLLVIWNRLDLARRDEEKDAIRSLDLLYRRVETEILVREATPAMRLLNEMLNMHDGFDHDGWLKACKKLMIETFPREDPFSILVPAGFDLDKHHGPMRPNIEADDVLLRVDFVREVDVFLQEVRSEHEKAMTTQALDPESVASRLKWQEKQRAVDQVLALLELAVNLTW